MLGEQEMSLRTLNNAIIRASIVLVCGSDRCWERDFTKLTCN